MVVKHEGTSRRLEVLGYEEWTHTAGAKCARFGSRGGFGARDKQSIRPAQRFYAELTNRHMCVYSRERTARTIRARGLQLEVEERFANSGRSRAFLLCWHVFCSETVPARMLQWRIRGASSSAVTVFRPQSSLEDAVHA